MRRAQVVLARTALGPSSPLQAAPLGTVKERPARAASDRAVVLRVSSMSSDHRGFFSPFCDTPLPRPMGFI